MNKYWPQQGFLYTLPYPLGLKINETSSASLPSLVHDLVGLRGGLD